MGSQFVWRDILVGQQARPDTLARANIGAQVAKSACPIKQSSWHAVVVSEHEIFALEKLQAQLLLIVECGDARARQRFQRLNRFDVIGHNKQVIIPKLCATI